MAQPIGFPWEADMIGDSLQGDLVFSNFKNTEIDFLSDDLTFWLIVQAAV